MSFPPNCASSRASRSNYTSYLTRISLLVAFLVFSCLQANAATYIGTNTGAIADGTSSSAGFCGAPRDVNFSVAGWTGLVGSVSVSYTMTHPYAGDLRVTLIAPNSTSHLLFSRIGATAMIPFGDSSNMTGTYIFNDLATANIWTAAAGVSASGNIPNASYRTQLPGPFTNVSPGPAFTSMNPVFAGMDASTVDGTWRLRFEDCSGADLGSVSAAALTLNPTLAGESILSGRVLTRDGAGIRGAYVTVSGGSLAQPKTVQTSTFGRYSFEGLDAGESYVISVSAKRYFFDTPALLVTLDSDIDAVDFVSN